MSDTTVWRSIDMTQCNLRSPRLLWMAIECRHFAAARSGGAVLPLHLNVGDVSQGALRSPFFHGHPLFNLTYLQLPGLAVVRRPLHVPWRYDELSAALTALPARVRVHSDVSRVDPFLETVQAPGLRAGMLFLRPEDRHYAAAGGGLVWPSVRHVLGALRPEYGVAFRCRGARNGAVEDPTRALRDVVDFGVKRIMLKGTILTPAVAALLVQASPTSLRLEEVARRDMSDGDVCAFVRALCRARQLKRLAFVFEDDDGDEDEDLGIQVAMTLQGCGVEDVSYLGSETAAAFGKKGPWITTILLQNRDIRTLTSGYVRDCKNVLDALKQNRFITSFALRLRLNITDDDINGGQPFFDGRFTPSATPICAALAAAAQHHSLVSFRLDCNELGAHMENSVFASSVAGAVAGLIRIGSGPGALREFTFGPLDGGAREGLALPVMDAVATTRLTRICFHHWDAFHGEPVKDIASRLLAAVEKRGPNRPLVVQATHGPHMGDGVKQACMQLRAKGCVLDLLPVVAPPRPIV